MIRNSVLTLLLFITLAATAQTYEEMVNKSMDFLEQKDYFSAEQALKSALRKEPANPNNIMLMVNLGTIQRYLGKLDDALISYNIAIDKYPDKAFLRHSRAALYCEMGNYDDALKDYNAILLNDEKDLDALYQRGLVNLYEKKTLEAEADFEKILTLSPDNIQAKMGIGLVLKRKNNWNEAEELYTDLIYKNRSNPTLYFNRAECYLQMNKLGRTGEDINKAISLGYNEPEIFILRGQLRLAQYDKRLAKEDFLKAKEMGASDEIISDYLLLCK